VTFNELSLHESILKAIADAGYTTPTPIQAQAIPEALAGHDLVASAQTGTGKTAAFVLPTLQRLTTPAAVHGRGPRVLVLTPTRELAQQVTDAAMKYGRHLRFRMGSIVGGVSYGPQLKLLSQPLDILVATPGRLLDHMESGRIDYSRLEVLVLDEADRMLDMGFVHAVTQIAAATPANRQTLLFSATLEGDVAKLTSRMMKNPKRIQIASVQERHENIEQRLHHVDGGEHKHSLLAHMLDDNAVDKAIVFTATKRGADRLAKRLHAQGHPAAPLHGNMNQNQRNRAIQSLRTGRVRLLVATDVAARGLDVNGITHVFNFDLPKNAEDYVHRIGRTGRAGAKGIAISFAAPEDRHQLRDIERYTKRSIPAHVIEGMEPTRAASSEQRRPNGPRSDRGGYQGQQRKPAPHRHQQNAGRNSGQHRGDAQPRFDRAQAPRQDEARGDDFGNRRDAGGNRQPGQGERRHNTQGQRPQADGARRHAGGSNTNNSNARPEGRRDGNRPVQRRPEQKSFRRDNQRPSFG
jgi:superfamily II DNA/RNA helicase